MTGAPAYLDHDLPCRGCNFNLRGLDPSATCPECGVPVRVSRYPDLLEFANPFWLDRVSRGVKWVLLTAVLWLVYVLSEGFLPIWLGRAPWDGLLVLLFSFPMARGFWLVTTPEAGLTRRAGPASSVMTRWLLLIGFGAAVTSSLAFGSPALREQALLIFAVALCAFGAGTARLSYLAASWAERLPRPGMARSTIYYGHVLAALSGVLLTGFVARAAERWTPPPYQSTLAIRVLRGMSDFGSTTVFPLIFGMWLMGVVVLIAYAYHLRHAAQRARQWWEAHSETPIDATPTL